jgi:hypothetical protein
MSHQQCKMQTQRVVHSELAWSQTIYQQVILYYVTFIFIQWHLEESIFYDQCNCYRKMCFIALNGLWLKLDQNKVKF